MKKQLILKGVSEDTGKPFIKEIHSLNEVRQSGNYIVVARNLSGEYGLPAINGKTKKCFCCEAILEVARCYPEDESQSKCTYFQKLTICDREASCGAIYTRMLTQKNSTSWQMVATGDPQLITENNSINASISKIEQQSLASSTMRFSRIKEDETTINAGMADSIKEVVYYKPSNIYVAYDGDDYWDSWQGMEAYMDNGMIRKDKVYLCGGETYILVDSSLSSTSLSVIKSWILTEAYTVDNVKRDDDGNILSANIIYPNGISGRITLTYKDELVSNIVCVYDSLIYTITVNRDKDGNILTTNIQ